MAKPKKSPYERVPTPEHFKSQYEEDKYWDRERTKWIEGYSGLTGAHYFYMQEWTLKNIYGQAIRPYFKDTDMLMFEAYESCRKTGDDLLIIKRREAGLSSVFFGCIPIWNLLINPGATCLITSSDAGRIKGGFNDKLMYGFNNLHPSIRPPKQNEREFGFLNLGTKQKDKTGNWSGLDLGKVLCRETTLNHTVFESERSVFGFVDEAALHGKLMPLKASMKACFYLGSKKIGVNVFGGSIGEEKKGDETSKQNIKSIRDLYKDSKHLNLTTLFISGNMGLPEFMENGWSDTKAADEWIDSELERLSQAEDKTEYNNFKKFYPRSVDEALGFYSGEGFFDADLMRRIAEQRKRIAQERPPIANYNLRYTDSGAVESIPNKNGKFRIFLNPVEGRKYIAGTDPIPFIQESDGEGSDYCLVIKDYETNVYVAYYKYRSSNPDQIVMDSILLQKFYNDAKTMLEINRGDVIKQKYIDMEERSLLANRPQNLGIKFTDNRTKIGVYKNGKTAPRFYEAYQNYLQKYCEEIWFDEILEEATVFLQQNTDIADAMCCCELYDKSEVKKSETKYQQPEYREMRVFGKDSSGKTVVNWVKVRVG